MKALLSGLREAITGQINSQYGDPHRGLFKALLVGKRKDVDPDLRDMFMKTGTAHLLAISGLHIGLVSGAVFLLLLGVGLGQKKAAVFSIIFILFHIFIGGAGIPLQRAGWMSILMFLSLVLGRTTSSWNTFFFALSLILIWDPRALHSLAFQLSFLSVLSLIMWTREFREHWKLEETVFRSVIVLIGTFPVVLFHFNVFSFVSVFANVLAIPLFHMSLLNSFFGLLFVPVPLMSNLFAWMAKGFLDLGLEWIRLWALPQWGYLFLPKPNGAQLFLYYFFILSYGLLRRRKTSYLQAIRVFLVGGWLSVAGSLFWNQPQDKFELTFLSCGRNEMMHANFGPHNDWLINTGRKGPSNQARWILAPYLKGKGINKLSGVFLPDDLKKHTGGLHYIAKNFRLDYLLYPASKKSEFDIAHDSSVKRETKMIEINAGKIYTLGESGQVQILARVGRGYVFILQHESTKFLFLPPLNEEVIKTLEGHRNQILDIAVLVLSSQTETRRPYLESLFDWTDPIVTVISGENELLKNHLEERDITLLDPRKQGAVSFTINPDTRFNEAGKMEVRTFLGGKVF